MVQIPLSARFRSPSSLRRSCCLIFYVTPPQDKYNNCGIYFRHKMPTGPKPSGTSSMLVQCKTAPFRLYLSRSHTELNSPPFPSYTLRPAPPPESGSYSTRFLAGCGACLSPSQYKPSTPTPQPSSKHPLPSDQTAPGRASGEGANWGCVCGGAAGAEPN